jgi:hypothetical protein
VSKQKKQPEPSQAPSSPVQVVHYVDKLSMKEYDLVELHIQDETVVKRTVLAKDLPFIIVNKLLLKVKNQGFRNG